MRYIFPGSQISSSVLHRAFLGTLFSVALLFALLSGSPAAAQTLTGTIAGTVTDASGAILPDSKVTASSSSLIKGSVTAQSDNAGYYKFLELPPGTYSVRVEKDGFSSSVANGIIVNSAVNVTSNAKLAVGSVSQEVVVNGSAITIDTATVASQQVLGQQMLEGVPSGRNPWAEANMVPAVVPNTRDVGGSTGMQAATMVVHGSSTADQRFMIDGVNVTWAGGNGGSTAIYYDQGMFQEINYRIGALPADVGVSGVYMNMITKDGGNQIHGTLFANGASKGMQSNNIDTNLNNLLRKNISNAAALANPTLVFGNPATVNYDYNGSIGGPILHDKLWYFGSFRYWKVNNIVSGAFNADNSAAINDNLIVNEMVKLSYQLNEKNKFSGMYSRNQKNRYHRRNSPPYFVDNKASWLQNQPGSTVIAKWIFTPNAKWVVDSGAGYTHIKYPQRYQKEVLPTDISVTDSALSTLQNAPQYNYRNPTWRMALTSSATSLINTPFGSHNLHVGGEYTHDYYAEIYTENGDLQAVFVGGKPNSAALSSTPVNQTNNQMDTLSFYGQDSWKLGKKLTINAGIRFEWLRGHIPAETSPANRWMNILNNSTATTYQYAAQNDIPNWKNFTPRLGFAYDVTGHGRTVIKGSFSKYMQGQGMSLIYSVNQLQYVTNSVPWTVDTNGNGLPDYYAPGDPRNEFNPAAGAGFASGYSMAPGIRRPNSWEQSVGVEQHLPLDFILNITGWHRATSDQIGRTNTLLTPSGYDPIDIANPAGGRITVYNQHAAVAPRPNYVLSNSSLLNNDYRGLDFSLSKSLSRNFLLTGGVTWSRFRGAINGDVTRTLDDLNNPNNNINRIGVMQSYDIPVQLKFSGVYKLPYRFELSGDVQHATGAAITETLSLTNAIIGRTLNQSATVNVVPSGPVRISDTNLADLRISRPTHFGSRFEVKPEFDVYNLTNSAAYQAVNQSLNTPAVALNPTTIMPPRLFKIGAQLQF